MKSLTVMFVALSSLMGCSTIPRVTVDKGSFPITDLDTHRFRKGDPTHGEFGVQFGGVARDNFVRLFGKWRNPTFAAHDLSGKYYGGAACRNWNIEVHPRITDAQSQAIEHAQDGYAAKLAWTLNASARICPRFERKSFSWGKAVSFFVQYQNDNTNYVPNNGMLTYEVHGMTLDGRYIRASFGVTHRSLTEFGENVRDYRYGDPADLRSPMRHDEDYILVETAPPSSFEPSLNDIDRFISTMTVK